ncbi:MAG: histone deacetylase [Bdellovibrionales bacterium]|nr:histone deacetylase [Bdellovibrionales bacterium]
MNWENFQFFYTDHIEVPLPPGHRFPMQKYRMLHQALVEEGVMTEAQLHPAPEAETSELLYAHKDWYVNGLINNTLPEKQFRPIGLTWSPELIRRSLAAVGGFMAVTESALKNGYSSLLAGGTHHAHADEGEGYCLFNDFACAALRLLELGKVKKILIIDLDVHQGNGNSSILGKREDVFILSLHGERNYPFRKIPSHLDVALPQGTTDEQYLKALSQALAQVSELFEFDIIFYQAGVDNLKEDSLGTFELTFEGLMKRDQMVFEFAQGKPLAMAIGGGYSKPIELSVRAHVNTFKVAKEFFSLN